MGRGEQAELRISAESGVDEVAYFSIIPMKPPCPECAASPVWIGVAKVTRERGALVMQWRCSLCAHEWGVEIPRKKPPRASLRPRRARRRA